MTTASSLVFRLVVIAFSSIQICYGKGFIEIRLKKLDNPKHFESGRECCDVYPWNSCRGKCDTQLNLCVTSFGNDPSRVSCNLGKVTTKVYDSQSTIVFTENENLGNGLTNPLKFDFSSWKKFFEVMFTSYDYDIWPLKDDLIDVYSDIIYTQPAVNSSVAKSYDMTIKGRVSSISFSYKVYCDNNSQNEKCQ